MKTNYFIFSVFVFLFLPLIVIKAQHESNPFVLEPKFFNP